MSLQFTGNISSSLSLILRLTIVYHCSVEPELLLFTMDPKYPSGSDLISKFILRHPDVVKMIIMTVIGKARPLTLINTSTDHSCRRRGVFFILFKTH